MVQMMRVVNTPVEVLLASVVAPITDGINASDAAAKALFTFGGSPLWWMGGNGCGTDSGSGGSPVAAGCCCRAGMASRRGCQTGSGLSLRRVVYSLTPANSRARTILGACRLLRVAGIGAASFLPNRGRVGRKRRMWAAAQRPASSSMKPANESTTLLATPAVDLEKQQPQQQSEPPPQPKHTGSVLLPLEGCTSKAGSNAHAPTRERTPFSVH